MRREFYGAHIFSKQPVRDCITHVVSAFYMQMCPSAVALIWLICKRIIKWSSIFQSGRWLRWLLAVQLPSTNSTFSLAHYRLFIYIP